MSLAKRFGWRPKPIEFERTHFYIHRYYPSPAAAKRLKRIWPHCERKGILCYGGIAANPTLRTADHTSQDDRNPKAYFDAPGHVEITVRKFKLPRSAALKYETRFIKRHQPLWNIQGRRKEFGETQWMRDAIMETGAGLDVRSGIGGFRHLWMLGRRWAIDVAGVVVGIGLVDFGRQLDVFGWVLEALI